MIVACPSCRAKFRIDESRIRPPGVRLRCARCQTMFAVRKRVLEPAPAPVREEPGNAVVRPAIAGPEAASTFRGTSGALSRILVAHESVAFLSGVRAQLERDGYEVLAARDGVEAIMRIQRELPRAVVIDAALPKMYGFEICEFMKRNESLRGIRVVLVASDNGKARYKRSPGNLYGADDYVEIHDIPHALQGILRRLLEPEQAGSACGQESEGAQTPVSEITPPAPAPSGPTTADGLDPEREKARRLARIIVSDIALYNESVIQEGIRNGRLLEMLRDDLEEGYRLFRTRVPAAVAEERDYIRQALMAFIEKKRGAAGPAAASPGAGVEDDSF